MTYSDYITVQRVLGQLEALGVLSKNEELSSFIYDAVEILDCIIDKYKPNEEEK